MNSRATTYWSAVKVQEEGAEVANQLQECFADALNEFKKKNGAFPKRVVIYRDGVGTGQMSAVSTIEVPQLKAAISEVTDGQDDEIKLMVVLVNKRISQRFFNGMRGRLQNPEPGTVVSSSVVEQDSYDFYIISTLSRQGVVSPTHCTVIYDTIKEEASKIEMLTYKLCFTYYNVSGSIKVPAPI